MKTPHPPPSATRRATVVLLVDDETDTRFVARLLLEAEGCHVIEAGNGSDALAHLARTDVDVVVTDTDMPDMDGSELVTLIRQQPDTAHIPVLAWGEREPHELAADATLAKGAGVTQLATRVTQLAARTHRSSPAPPRTGPA